MAPAPAATGSPSILDQLSNWFTGGFGGSTGTSGLGFDPSNPTGNLGSLLGGITGTSNPLADVMAILSFINQGEITQEQMGLMNNVINSQKSSLGTAGSPNALSAWTKALTPQGMAPETFQALMQGFTPQGQNAATLGGNMAALTPQGQSAGTFAGNMSALTPQGMSPGTYGDIATQLTGQLSQPFIANALNPVTAQLAASGQDESSPVRQYVSEQALAPYSLQLSQMGQEGANQMLSQGLQEQQFGYGGAGQLLGQGLTEQGTGASLATDLLNQMLTEQQTGFAGAGDFLNQLLSEQGMGQNMSQFSLSLPNTTRYDVPNFGFVNPMTGLFGAGGASSFSDPLGNFLNDLGSSFGGAGSGSAGNLIGALGSGFSGGTFNNPSQLKPFSGSGGLFNP